jgi:DNA-binding transcriptional MerR regulator/ubiquinone/menaquinone biosynthesis C-methylase UbiE/uncharacterized protein YbaR (Trm112 family)
MGLGSIIEWIIKYKLVYTNSKELNFMKIGQFANNNNVSIDTIRYYIELKLIMPERTRGQYDFDESCQSDLDEILWLKSADFSLNEIQKIFSLKRFTNLKNDVDLEYYRLLFGNKKQELSDRRNEIDKIIKKIDEKIRNTDNNLVKISLKLGMPIDYLHILACPTCKSGLRLVKGSIEDNLIIDGELKCSGECEYGYESKSKIELKNKNRSEKNNNSNRNSNGFCDQCQEPHSIIKIKDGILIIEKDCKENEPSKDIIEGHFIEQTSSDYVNLFYKSGQWIRNKLDLKNQEASIILEPGTGSGIFLNGVLNELNQETLYICIDHSLEKLRNTKETIEKHHNKTNIIFICCDFLNIPIKDGVVDILLDHFGTSNYNFHKEGFLINLIGRLVKPGGKWIGDYFNFKKVNAKSLLQFEEKYRKYFLADNIVKALENSEFKTLEMREMGYTEKGGIFEKFFIEGDTLYDFVYYGEKIK